MDEQTRSDDTGRELGNLSEYLILEPSEISVAPKGYDPVAPFRGGGVGSRSVTVSASANEAHVEWVAHPHRYGHFSGRPLDPVEIAMVARREKRRRWARRSSWLGFLLGLIGLFVWNLTNDPWLPASRLEAGTCFQDSLSSLIVRGGVRYEVRSTVEVVDCNDPHQYESIGTVPLSGLGDPSTLAVAAHELCTPLFEAYVGANPLGSTPWRLETFPPYLQLIADERAHCLVYQGDRSEPIKVVGAARTGSVSG
ncbi:MAG: hypothetical protein ACR2JP_04310 [Acidimicrobiia bacterium]